MVVILSPELFWPTVRKKCSSDRGKTFKPQERSLRICKIFEITRTIYWNSERSVQFLKRNAFLTCYWRFQKKLEPYLFLNYNFYFQFVLTFVDYHDHFFLAKRMGFDHPVTQVRIHKYPCHRRQNIQRWKYQHDQLKINNISK